MRVERMHLMKSLSSNFSFRYTMTFALSSEPDKYDKKLAISTLNVDSKTLEYASAFSKNDGTGTIITILKQITAEIHQKTE